MARRLPKEDKPYNPIEAALVQSVAAGKSAPPPPPAPVPEQPKVIPFQTSAPMQVEESPRQPAAPEATEAKAGREKRVILSWEEELAVNDILKGLSKDLRTPVKLSNLLRACVMLVRHGENELRRCGQQASALVRPANKDQAALAYFEHRLAKLLLQSLKNSRMLE